MHQPPKRLASGRPVRQSSAADGVLSPCISLHHPITKGSTFNLAALRHSDQRQEPESACLLPFGPTPCAKSIIVANWRDLWRPDDSSTGFSSASSALVSQLFPEQHTCSSPRNALKMASTPCMSYLFIVFRHLTTKTKCQNHHFPAAFSSRSSRE
jgi:hypothetical protein